MRNENVKVYAFTDNDTNIRRKLSALSSLFDYLCERNAVAGNPVDGVAGEFLFRP